MDYQNLKDLLKIRLGIKGLEPLRLSLSNGF